MSQNKIRILPYTSAIICIFCLLFLISSEIFGFLGFNFKSNAIYYYAYILGAATYYIAAPISIYIFISSALAKKTAAWRITQMAIFVVYCFFYSQYFQINIGEFSYKIIYLISIFILLAESIFLIRTER